MSYLRAIAQQPAALRWMVASVTFLFIAAAATAAADDVQFQIVDKGRVKTAIELPPPRTFPKDGEIPVTSPNPYLAFLPVEVAPDYQGWQARMSRTAEQRAIARAIQRQAEQAAGAPMLTITQGESEAVGVKGGNDTIATADAVPGFGSGAGDDPEADLDGNLKTAPAPTGFTQDAEDEGDIGKATDTLLMTDESKVAMGSIGDGPFGSGGLTVLGPGSDVEDDGDIPAANATGFAELSVYSANGEIGGAAAQSSTGTGTGDFDLYSFTLTEATTFVQIILERRSPDITFRPILGIYNGAGALLASFDDLSFPGSVSINANFGPGTFYLAVGGNLNFDGDVSDEFLTDANDSDTGPGAGSEGLYTLSLLSPTPGDFDFYRVDLTAGDLLDVEVDTDPYGGILDPIVAVYDGSGTLIGFNDDGANPPGTAPFDSQISITAPASGPYFISVGGFSTFPTTTASFLADPFDSSSGPGSGSEGGYDIIVSNNVRDVDVFSFELEAGDVIAANITGAAPAGFIMDGTGTTLTGAVVDVSGIFPASSPLPGGGNAAFAHIVNTDGTYYLGVAGGEGFYGAELRVFRPPSEATGTKQRLFIDFDGATIDAQALWGGNPNAVLSPLSSFLAGWGLAPGDEDALIDAILAEVENTLNANIKAVGANDNFDIEILNSRDHADPWGDPDVSRVIVGGTIAESGISTIGIAQTIDVGNWDQAESALVLLDLLSAPASNPNSLNQYGLAPGATQIELVAAGVGNITSHEAGHFFSDFHTENFNVDANIMDTGGNLANSVGVGADGIFGNGDDTNVQFIEDNYDSGGGLFGREDTLNFIGWSLTADSEVVDTTGFTDATGDFVPDYATFVAEPGVQPRARIMSGADGSVYDTYNFLNPAWTGVAIDTVDDANGDGQSTDPGVAMLLIETGTNKLLVQVRDAATGANINKINFLNPDWAPVDVVVINDVNGDGDPSDAAIGVMAVNRNTGKILIQVRDLGTGAKIATRSFLNSGYTPLGVASISGLGQTASLGVLGIEKSTGKNLVQTRVMASGALVDNAKYFNTDWTSKDIVHVNDGNSDGNANDPVWLVLAKNKTTGANLAQARLVSSGAKQKDITYLTTAYDAQRLGSSPDISGTTYEEVGVMAVRPSDTQRILQVRDYSNETRTLNIFP